MRCWGIELLSGARPICPSAFGDWELLKQLSGSHHPLSPQILLGTNLGPMHVWGLSSPRWTLHGPFKQPPLTVTFPPLEIGNGR